MEMIQCSICGESHALIDTELTFKYPDCVFQLSEDQRQTRCKISHDVVIFDESRFFVRVLHPLPILGAAKRYCIGLWVEVGLEEFLKIDELWDGPAQADLPGLLGKLSNSVPYHHDTVGLQVFIQLTGPKTRPAVYLDVEHTLAKEQISGISAHRAFEYSNVQLRRDWSLKNSR